MTLMRMLRLASFLLAPFVFGYAAEARIASATLTQLHLTGGYPLLQDNGQPYGSALVDDFPCTEPAKIAFVRGSSLSLSGQIQNILTTDNTVFSGTAIVQTQVTLGKKTPVGGGCAFNTILAQTDWSSGAEPGVEVQVANGSASFPEIEVEDFIPIAGTGSATLHVAVLIYDKNDTSWEFRRNAGDGTWLAFVLSSSPLTTTGFYSSVLNAACPDYGLTGPTDAQALVNRIWQTFSGRNMQGENGQPLYYYKAGATFANTPSQSLAQLLHPDTQNGQCGLWALFFKQSIAVHGLQSTIIGAAPSNFSSPGGMDNGFLVKDFTFNGPSGTGGYSYKFQLQTACGTPHDMVPVPAGAAYGDLTSLNILFGQNTAPPSQKAFGSHYFIKYGSTYYDASYGVTYLSESDFESKALCGYISTESSGGADCVNGKQQLGVRKQNQISTSLVTGITPSSVIRNNATGWVGLRLIVGGHPLTVTELGRWVVSGNGNSHTVKLVASNGIDVPGGAATVHTSGQAAGSFAYAPLQNPVTLNPNTAYYLVSDETWGGDQWYDWSSQLNFSGATIASAAYNTGTGYLNVGTTKNGYGPVSMKWFKTGVRFFLP